MPSWEELSRFLAHGTTHRRLRDDTGWSPRLGALDEIVRTAWAWHASHPLGFDDRNKA